MFHLSGPELLNVSLAVELHQDHPGLAVGIAHESIIWAMLAITNRHPRRYSATGPAHPGERIIHYLPGEYLETPPGTHSG